MRTFSALWQAYQAETNPTWAYEHKCVIDGQTYTRSEIHTHSRSGGLTADDFSLGNCIAQVYKIDIQQKAGVIIPKNAQVEPYVRIVGSSGSTDWYRLGIYFIDNRTKPKGGRISLSCCDRLRKADQLFLTDGETVDDYPMPMDTAINRICAAIGCTLDARTSISHSMTIEYPNDMTMRQVAGMVASAHAGNFVMTEEDKLRLIVPGYTGSPVATVSSSSATKTQAGNDPTTFDSVSMIYTDDGACYTAGSGNYVVEVTNYWATQAMCNAVQALINGYVYSPYKATKADLDPAVELGDYITINGTTCNLWRWSWNNRFYCDIDIPSADTTSESEFTYTGTVKAALKKKVSLGANYYGTSISKEKGIYQQRGDGKSEFLLNSDTFAMRAQENGFMVDKVYFDPLTGQYIFMGTVIINAGDVSDLFNGIDSDMNLLVDEVDNLDGATVKKDALYNGVRIGPTYGFEAVRSDKKARAYFRSDGFKMQSGDGSGTSWEDKLYYDPVMGKYFFSGDVFGSRFFAGSPLAPGSYVEMSPTGLKVYNADGLLKTELSFTSDGYDYPYLSLGSGTGAAASKGLIKKFSNGLWMGNSAPQAVNGAFVPQSGYSGLFVNTAEHKVYVIDGTNMQNVYTGYAIAKFGG